MARMFLGSSGYIVCDEVEMLEGGLNEGRVKLIRPLKIVPQKEGSVSLNPIFIKENWMTMEKADLGYELEISDTINTAYNRAKTEIFTGIVLL
jgi:hypothetical protein